MSQPTLNQISSSVETKIAHHPPMAKIKDTAILILLRSNQVKLVTEVVKNKKKGKADLYGSEFRWVDTNEPLLTSDGVVDCTATVVWGVRPPEGRNTGEFGKPDGPFDECEMQFGTKSSGSFGEFMCELNDRTYPNSINEFTSRPDQKSLYAGHDIDPHQFCKKFAGSLKTPAPDADQKAYADAADWSFSVKLKIQKYIIDKKTNARKIVPNQLFMCKVVRYVLDARGIPVEQEIKINSHNVHKELTRGSKILLAMRPGNGTMKASAYKGKTVNTFHAAWNFNHITVIKKGEFTAAKVDRTPDEIRAALAEAGVVLTYEPNAAPQQDEDPSDDEPPEESQKTISTLGQADVSQSSGSAQYKPSSGATSASDLANQFISRND